jgi:hypothetical protein
MVTSKSEPSPVDDWPASIVVVRSGLEQGEFTLLDPKGAAVGANVRSKVAANGH